MSYMYLCLFVGVMRHFQWVILPEAEWYGCAVLTKIDGVLLEM